MLKENEWHTINSLLLKVYQVTTIKEFTEVLLKMFRILIPYTQGDFLIFDDNQNIDHDESYFIGMNKNLQDDYMDYFYEIDYIKYILDVETETCVYRDTDIIADEVRKKTEFYEQFLSSNNIPYGCGVVLMKDGRQKGLISLFISEALGDFSEKDMYIFDVLKMHIANIVCNLQDKQVEAVHETVCTIDDIGKKCSLTDREKEIANMIKAGSSNKDISEQLILSLSTVKKHIYNIYTKMGISSRTQLVALF